MRDLPDDQISWSAIWAALRDDARALADKEPFLARIVDDTILNAASFQKALARQLAAAIGIAENCHGDLYETLLSGLKRHPSIAFAAARDLVAVRQSDPTCSTYLHALLNYKSFHALEIHRIAHALWHECKEELAVWLSNRVSAALGPDIHPAARLGKGIMLDHGSGIVIGETAHVEDGVTILQNVTLGGTGKVVGDRHPKVREGAMIGAGAIVLGNIEIGAFSKVGAGSVVLDDVPPGCTVVGVPARIVRRHHQRSEPELSRDDTKIPCTESDI